MKVVEQSFSCTACNAAHCGGWKRSDRVSNCAVLILVVQLECLIRGDLFLSDFTRFCLFYSLW